MTVVALIRSWPFLIRRSILLLGLVAISSYIDFVHLDIGGSQIRDSSAPSWTDFEESRGGADQLARTAMLASMPLRIEEATVSETAGRDCYSDVPPVQLRCRRSLPRILRIAHDDSHTPALSADPA